MARIGRMAGLVVAGTGLLALAGCGGSESGGAADAGTQPITTTVAVRSVDGVGDALVDSAGKTLYMTDQDSAASIACASKDCTSLWHPLTVMTGDTPTGPGEVSGKLSTVKRPDGTSQVAYDGKPLYTFTLDKGPGDASGNGVKDSFGGPELTWHALTAAGAATAQPSEGSDDGGYGY